MIIKLNKANLVLAKKSARNRPQIVRCCGAKSCRDYNRKTKGKASNQTNDEVVSTVKILWVHFFILPIIFSPPTQNLLMLNQGLRKVNLPYLNVKNVLAVSSNSTDVKLRVAYINMIVIFVNYWKENKRSLQRLFLMIIKQHAAIQ
jgi:hypothetical protein